MFLKKLDRVIPWLLVALIVLNFLAVVKTNLGTYLAKYEAAGELNYYMHSRYFQGDKADYLPTDTQVHAARGYQFVVLFQDPEKTLHDHPLLGTYLIGLSLLLFHNPVVFSLAFGVLVLYLCFRLTELITGNRNLGLLAALFLSLEPLFVEQITSSLLDLYLLLFSLAALVAYQLWRKLGLSRYIWLSQLCLGFAFATKFFISTLPLFGAMYLATLFSGNFRRFIDHTKALFVIPVAYLLGHATYFYFHPSLISFAKYQRYMFSWWAGTPTIKPFGVWPLIFQNQWHTWWGTEAIVPVDQWWWGWPVFVALGLLSLPLLWLRRKKISLLIAPYGFVLFNLMFFSLSLVFPRYLVLILPIAVGLSLKLLQVIFWDKRKRLSTVE